MIKPSNIDFTTPMAALLSYEKARFSGYDLEASTEEPVVLEDTPEYTLIAVELVTSAGKTVQRRVKAWKNGETELVDPEPGYPPLILSASLMDENFERLTFTVNVTGGVTGLGDLSFMGQMHYREHGVGGAYTTIEKSFSGGGSFELTIPAADPVKSYDVYFTALQQEGLSATSPVVTYQQPEPPFKFNLSPLPSVLHETQDFAIVLTPPDATINQVNIPYVTEGVNITLEDNNVLRVVVDPSVVEDLTEVFFNVKINDYTKEFSTIYEKTEVNVGANYEARLTFAEDGLDVHRGVANPGDVVYAAISAEGLTYNQNIALELSLDGAVATLNTANPIRLIPGQLTVVPIQVTSASKADATMTVLMKKDGAVVGVSRSIAVAQVAVVPTEIILNPQDGHIGGTSMGLSYSFDVPNYSAHNLTVSTNQAGVTFETFSPENNLVEEGTIHVGFDQSKIPDLTVINIVVSIDGLTKTTAMTYHHG